MILQQVIKQKDFIPLIHYAKAWNRNNKADHLLEYIWIHLSSNLAKLQLLTQTLSVFPEGVGNQPKFYSKNFLQNSKRFR